MRGAGGIACAALAAALTGCAGSGVPDLTGLSESEADAKLAKAGMRRGSVRFDIVDESKVGKVIVQTPAAGTKIADAPGATVDLVMGGIATPKLIDRTADAAALELRRLGLALGDVLAVPKLTGTGLVTEQNPAVGAPVARGGKVSMTVHTPLVLDLAKGVFLDRMRSSGDFQKLPEEDRRKIEQAIQQLR